MKRWNARQWSYVLLLNMGIVVYFMLQEPVRRMIPGLALLLAVALLQIAAVRRPELIRWTALGQLSIVILLGFAYHPMYTYLIFVFVHFYMNMPLRWMFIFTVIFAVSVPGMMFRAGHLANIQMWLNILPPLFGGLALPYIIRVSNNYRETVNRLKAATKEIERLAQSEERQRIAQELHDTLGHTLSLLALKGEVVERMIERAPDKAAAEAREIQKTAAAALRRMRELVNDMKVVRLSDEWEHALSLCAAANIRLTIRNRLEPRGIVMTALQESVIAMCLREAVTNVVRHSQATECVIELSSDESGIRCMVEDNGKGARGAGTEMSGNGIVGMKQRLAHLEGHLSIETGSGGKGARLLMTIPIVRKQYGGVAQ